MYEPEFAYHRQMLTKVFMLITTIDDIYDIYGTLEELQLFTTIVEKLLLIPCKIISNYFTLYLFAYFFSESIYHADGM